MKKCTFKSVSGSITHGELIPLAIRFLRKINCGAVLTEKLYFQSRYGEMPDAIGWRSDCSILIECKATRSDFLADKKKPFRKDCAMSMGDWKFYLAPAGLILPSELRAGWGLIECNGKRLGKIYGGPRGNYWGGDKPFVGNKRQETRMLYSGLRKMQKKFGFETYHPSPHSSWQGGKT